MRGTAFDCGLRIADWLKRTDAEISGYIETGERSVVEDFEEAAADTDYSCMKYHLKFSRQISKRFGYKVGWDVYDKDYEDADNLDSISRTYTAGINYVLRQGDKRDPWPLTLTSCAGKSGTRGAQRDRHIPIFNKNT